MSVPAATLESAPSMDVLLDVELPLTLRFGSTQMAFGEVMGLSSGSLIEFQNAADSPVELLINGRTVARGELVMVQGSYGIRIIEIASRRARSHAAARDAR